MATLDDPDDPPTEVMRLKKFAMTLAKDERELKVVELFFEENKMNPVELGLASYLFFKEKGMGDIQCWSISYALEKEWQRILQTKPLLICHMTDKEVITQLCSSYEENNKKATAALQPLLEEKNNLGSMDPDDLSSFLYRRLTAQQCKDFNEEISIALRHFKALQRFPLEFSKFKAHCDLSPRESKRVFYLVDMVRPTKMEIVLHSEDTNAPPFYEPHYLHPNLRPQYANSSLNNGVYLKVREWPSICCYFYTFNQTTAASDAGLQNLELHLVSNYEEVNSIESILPSLATASINVEPYSVPKRFIGIYDVLLIRKKALKEGGENERKKILKLLEEQQVSTDILTLITQQSHSDNDSSASSTSTSYSPKPGDPPPHWKSVPGNEVTRNQRLALWVEDQLKKNFGSEYVFLTDQAIELKVSRFGRSKDDFSFFLKGRKRVFGVSVCEEVQLFGVSDDCEEEAEDKDMYQVLANMNKCAADIACSSINRQVLFNRITIVGLLVDYSREVISHVYKLELYFNDQRSSLQTIKGADLGIQDAFSRTFAALQNAVVVST